MGAARAIGIEGLTQIGVEATRGTTAASAVAGEPRKETILNKEKTVLVQDEYRARRAQGRRKEKQLRRGAAITSRWGFVSSWSAIGTAFGYFLALFLPLALPHSSVPPHQLAAALAGLLGAAAFLGWLPGGKADNVRQLRNCLAEVNQLFTDGLVGRAELSRLRARCLDKF